MMRPIHILLVALAMLLPYAAFAEDYLECKQTCVAERDSRNMNCPSPYDVSDNGQERRQCMKDNQDAYNDCIRRCPTPPPPPSSEEQPPPMAY